LANVNTLGRTADLPLKQLKASIAVVRLFVDETIDAGEEHEAQRLLKEYAEILRTRHVGKSSQVDHKVDALSLLSAYSKDSRLDYRWRTKTNSSRVRGLKEQQISALRRKADFLARRAAA
jgi:hypothetical protein